MRVHSALELEDNRTLFKSASMNAFASTIGFIAATLTTIAFVPQVIKVWRSRSARDVSLGMYALFTTGVAVWLLYGFLISSWPVILANAITLVLAIAVIVMKLRFDGR